MSDKDDDRDYKLTFSCERGGPWRKFKRDFLAVARGKFAKDDRYSFRTAYEGISPMQLYRLSVTSAVSCTTVGGSAVR